MRAVCFIALLAVCSLHTAQSYVKVSAAQVEEVLKRKTDTTYVVNFFASWCAPCMQELPELQAFAQAHAQEQVQLIFVSLDFEEDAENKLLPLLRKFEITQPVWLLVETGNRWITRIDRHWNGSIPATLVFNNTKKKRTFITQRVTRTMLNQYMQQP
jgi:thiol-disulfide isomerase/thioredoxin